MIRLAITMGDPAGIGPEIIIKAFQGEEAGFACLPTVIGSCDILRKTAEALNLPVQIRTVDAGGAYHFTSGVISVIEPEFEYDLRGIFAGAPQKECGSAAKSCIDLAVRSIQEGQLDALCTAPISKEAMKAAGFGFPGHTEYLADLSGTDDFAMLLCGGGLRVALATIHTALSSVPGLLSVEGILAKLRLLHKFIPLFGAEKPRLGVCGVNPHAGEGGMFGNEEAEKITPAITKARMEGIDASGPFPADTIFYRMLKGDFDAILAMYHDQGLGPLKTVGFRDGVNITMGLPFIRTSVDHGTGFDIAGKGIADPASLIAAIKLAVFLGENQLKRK